MDAPAADLDTGDVDPVALDWPILTGVSTAEVDDDAAAILDTAADTDPLGEWQRAILEFERRWWRRPGAKEQAIRDQFEMSPVRYYQALNSLLDLPEAVSYDATLVHRLQRLRTTSARSRRIR